MQKCPRCGYSDIDAKLEQYRDEQLARDISKMPLKQAWEELVAEGVNPQEGVDQVRVWLQELKEKGHIRERKT